MSVCVGVSERKREREKMIARKVEILANSQANLTALRFSELITFLHV